MTTEHDAQPDDTIAGESDVFRRLIDKLTASGVTYVHLHHEPVYTSAAAAEVRGSSLHSGAKALIVKAGDGFHLIVLPADLSLDSKALRKTLGCKRLRFANGDEVIALTGLKPGSIPPFGSLFDLPTVCDPALADQNEINFNAGSHTESIRMACPDFLSVETPLMANVGKAKA